VSDDLAALLSSISLASHGEALSQLGVTTAAAASYVTDADLATIGMADASERATFLAAAAARKTSAPPLRALVIGNSAYSGSAALANATADARAVHTALSAQPGAEVTLLQDCTRAQLLTALKDFAGVAQRPTKQPLRDVATIFATSGMCMDASAQHPGNSPFSGALASTLHSSSLTVADLGVLLVDAVDADTANAQRPRVMSSYGAAAAKLLLGGGGANGGSGSGTLGVFFFAGHGLKDVKGRKYLVPVDANVATSAAADAQRTCVSLDDVQDVLCSADVAAALLLLDAQFMVPYAHSTSR
jgi:hypothetical protein